MADYFSPTVIQQPIPIADMTPLERLVLSLIFDAEPDGEAMYFHTSLDPSDAIGLSIDELRAAFDASAGIDSTATTCIGERVAVASTDDSEIVQSFQAGWGQIHGSPIYYDDAGKNQPQRRELLPLCFRRGALLLMAAETHADYLQRRLPVSAVILLQCKRLRSDEFLRGRFLCAKLLA